jgi:hypothetical protein
MIANLNEKDLREIVAFYFQAKGIGAATRLDSADNCTISLPKPEAPIMKVTYTPAQK